ncbi:cytochrome c family protein [Sphaerotilus sp.]|uniref:c-type cytochrome n=1 Tax=Sphaerotilus sp. TaxID=2093942 RepID=UPI0034E1A7CF
MARRTPPTGLRRALLAAACTLSLTAPMAHAQAQATVDLKKAAGLFATHCSECHSVKEGKDKKGPSLFAVIGRKAGVVPGFVYSDALRQSGLVWSPAVLDRYIASPAGTVPGGKMKYDGLAEAPDRALVIAYLTSVSGPH